MATRAHAGDPTYDAGTVTTRQGAVPAQDRGDGTAVRHALRSLVPPCTDGGHTLAASATTNRSPSPFELCCAVLCSRCATSYATPAVQAPGIRSRRDPTDISL